MTAVNLSYKLRWMSAQLKWINKASDIQDWVAAMESVRSLLLSVVNIELVDQKLTTLIRKQTVSRPLNINILPQPQTKMDVTSEHDSGHSSHLRTAEIGESTSTRHLHSMNIDIPRHITSRDCPVDVCIAPGAVRDDPEIGENDIVLREPLEHINPEIDIRNIPSKEHCTKMNKPVCKRLLVKGIRT